MTTLQLKPGREASVGFHHPWVFSGALVSIPRDVADGEVVWVADRNGNVIGTGIYSSKGSIAVRLFAFAKAEINQEFITQKLTAAYEKRTLIGVVKEGAGFRLVHGEVDGLPGLVVDVFGDVAVIQISTTGTDKLREYVVAGLQTIPAVKVIHEKSDMDGRKEEGLDSVVQTHVGELPELVRFQENNLTFIADVVEGQKTGFFLDQRDLRSEVKRLSQGKTVLNLFSYTGASTLAALSGGAASVHNIDISSRALKLLNEHVDINNFSNVTSEEQDVFQWLNSASGEYDMVIVDPPALVKSKKDKEGAMKAYHFLNRAAMRLAKDGGLFVTSSCSHYVTEDDLMFVLRRAAVQAGVELSVIKSVRQAADHPLSIYFPEGFYLKSFVCQVKHV